MQHYYKNGDNDQDLYLTQKYKNKVIFKFPPFLKAQLFTKIFISLYVIYISIYMS